MNTKSSLLRASALVFFLGCTWLQAAVTVIFENNTPPPPPDPLLLEVNSSSWWAQSFTVTANYTLTSVVLRMGSSTDTPGGNFLVQIYDATGTDGRPGTTSLGSLIGEGNPFVEADHTFTPDPDIPIILNAGTYYVVAGVSDTGSYNWKAEDGSNEPIFIDEGSTSGFSNSGDGGLTWEGSPNPGLAFSMQVSAVPEPANMALGIFGAVLIGVQSFRWWSARRRQMEARVNA